MQVCILSDSHDHIPLLRAAIRAAKQQGAEVVLHCGDVVAPSTLGAVLDEDLPIHAIHGNNAGDLYMLSRIAHKSEQKLHYYGQDASFSLAGKRIFIVHYPHYAQALSITGNYDLVCCGHSHKPRIEWIDNIKGSQTLLCNPGTVGGVGDKPATYMLGSLDDMQFTVHELAS